MTYTRPRARKEHRCDLCGRLIHKGETYIRAAGFGDGTAWTWKQCPHCEVFAHLYSEHFADVDGYDPDGAREWALDTAVYDLRGEDYEPLLPAEYQISDGARKDAIGFLLRWTIDGAILPIPPLERTTP